MMAFVRMLVPLGLMGFGTVAAFMGLVVVINSLSTGKISYRYAASGQPVTGLISKDTDPGLYWRTLGLAGGLPALLGLGAIWCGRRVMYRAR